jgi:hypothetical protein
VIEEEQQTVLNTLPEHDVPVAFKKMAEALGTVHMAEEGYFEGNGGELAQG